MPNRVGQQFGNYRLTRLLGEGSFAEVYLGEHVHSNRKVAVKVLSRGGGWSVFARKTIQTGAGRLSKLRHSNIVEVLDFGEQSDEPFLVTKHIPVPGGTLRQQHPVAHIPQFLATLF